MIGLLCFVLAMLASPFKSKSRLEAENAVLRHQLINDRWFLVQMYRWVPSILTVVTIVQLKRWFGGIGQAFGAIGVGNRTRGEGVRQSRTNCAR